MIMICTFERFLGSLLGSYMGFHYQHNLTEWPSVHGDPLYAIWMQPPLLNLQCVDNNYLAPLPWLLCRYDNSRIRHHELAQYTETLAANSADTHAITTLNTLYILGDSLEWLIQCPLSTQQTRTKLWEYLGQRQGDYPVKPPSFNPVFCNFPPAASSPSKPDNESGDTLKTTLERTLNYRENLALALSSPMPPFTRTMLGGLLGAWRGLSVIPTPWMLLLDPKSQQALTQLAKQLYQNWAGMIAAQGTLETFPLDF